MFPLSCRYLQQLIDHESETAKQNGTFDKGVMFLENNVREVDRTVVWRNPKAGGGEVCSSCSTRCDIQCIATCTGVH